MAWRTWVVFDGRETWDKGRRQGSCPPVTLDSPPQRLQHPAWAWPLTWGRAVVAGWAGKALCQTLGPFYCQVGVLRAGLRGSWVGVTASGAVVAGWAGLDSRGPWKQVQGSCSPAPQPFSGAAHSRVTGVSPSLHQCPAGQGPQSSCSLAPGAAVTV